MIGTLNRALDPLEAAIGNVAGGAASLAQARLDRLRRLVDRYPEAVERDATGEPARRGELLLIAPSDAELNAATGAGFAVLGRENLGELGLSVVRLRVPQRLSLAKGERSLRALLPDAMITADNLHLPAGPSGTRAGRGGAAPAPRQIGTKIGVIDGAAGPAFAVEASRGFASGAPRASQHGSAITSLLAGAGVSRIVVADVYGSDPAGGNALAIARGLDWLLAMQVRVVSISLVGPRNPLLERAIDSARKRGMVIVAAVGNDGPAAPPAYPASYVGVVAVTAVDGRNRPLIEAGKALHLDYAAPGADIYAGDAAGRRVRVRGTSYAVPLVAARAAAAIERGTDVVSTLDREAVDLGSKGPDATFGRGLLCSACRPAR